MSDDTHDDMINLVDPSEYEDPVSQRAMAFCHVAKLADTVQDEAVKELCLTMLRKLNASIKRWLGLFEQIFRFDKWNPCRGDENDGPAERDRLNSFFT